jgi:hypothetical protein
MRPIFLPVYTLLLFFVSGCLSSTPFQSARVVESGEQSASVSLQKSVDANESQDYSWYMMEFATRLPMGSDRVDLALNGAIMAFNDDDGISGVGAMFGLGPKFEIFQDILAIDMPVRVMFAGEGSFESTHFYPRAIFSLPLSELVEINLSHTRFFYLNSVEFQPYGFSAGLALGRRGGIIFRPEIGIVVYPDGHDLLQFGIGFTPEGKTMEVERSQLNEGSPY